MAVGGIAGPLVFADLVGTGRPGDTAPAFSIGAALVIAAGVVGLFLGVRAERRGLESIALPLAAEEPQPSGAASA